MTSRLGQAPEMTANKVPKAKASGMVTSKPRKAMATRISKGFKERQITISRRPKALPMDASRLQAPRAVIGRGIKAELIQEALRDSLYKAGKELTAEAVRSIRPFTPKTVCSFQNWVVCSKGLTSILPRC